jgi:hypothetical protein
MNDFFRAFYHMKGREFPGNISAVWFATISSSPTI